MDSIKNLSRKIIMEIEKGNISTKRELNSFKKKLCKEMRIAKIPTDPAILAHAKKKTKKIIQVLRLKPTRSLSGISVVAIMAKPHDCPGKCIYCPNGLVGDMPKSYTGREPAAMRALANKFDSFKQAKNRIEQLGTTGHSTQKIELIVMGGTFPSMHTNYQKSFVRGALNAITGKKHSSLEQAKKAAETSKKKLVGITFETRPDYCKEKEINSMLELGGTRIEIGVQTIDDSVLEKINRMHSVQDVIEATQLMKDSCFKLAYHLMPGLPFTEPKKQLKEFKSIFKKHEFQPDMLKIYPCLVIKGTELYRMWKKGEYNPMDEKQAVKFISEFKESVPEYVRIMRIQRDIPSNVIEAGVKASNLRQLVQKEMKKHGKKCKCIRCREIGLKSKKENFAFEQENAELKRTDYNASNGKEIFLSYEDKKNNALVGFARLRIPWKPFRKEINDKTALIRELHVYGESLEIGKTGKGGQHKGFGKMLVQEAEKIAKEEFEKNNIVIISGLGVKGYYRKIGYKNDGPYVSRKI